MEKVWLRHYDPGVPAEIDYPEYPLHHLLDEAVDKGPERTAAVYKGKPLSYEELGSTAGRLAASLVDLGVRRADRVALLLPNCPQFLIAYFGILKAGAVAVPLDPGLSGADLLRRINDSGAETIVIMDDRASRSLIDSIRDRTTFKNIIVTRVRGGPSGSLLRRRKKPSTTEKDRGNYVLEDLLERKYPLMPPAPITGADQAAVFYTAGVSREPRGACLTHRNLIAAALQYRSWITDMKVGEETILSALPVFHPFAITTGLHLAVLTRSTILVVPRLDVSEVLRAMHTHRPAILTGAPGMFAAINRYPRLKNYDLSSLRFCISSGAPLPGGVKQQFERLTGCKFVESYGIAEAAYAVACNPIYGRNQGAGIPLPDTECQVVDIETGIEELPPNIEGELRIKGPQVMSGYCGNPGETILAVRKGWLYTGDIARTDQEGYFQVVDRKKDIVKILSPGEVTARKIYPSEIERMIMRHPKVLDVAVASAPGPEQGQAIRAYVVLKPKQKATANEVMAFCRETLAAHKVPCEIEFRRSLPRDVLGRIIRSQLQQGQVMG